MQPGFDALGLGGDLVRQGEQALQQARIPTTTIQPLDQAQADAAGIIQTHRFASAEASPIDRTEQRCGVRRFARDVAGPQPGQRQHPAIAIEHGQLAGTAGFYACIKPRLQIISRRRAQLVGDAAQARGRQVLAFIDIALRDG